ncbi:hypothetical protein H4R34_001166 [Dimargaris verticillata]|uniref:Pre-mRNA-splicing factor 18 n=1 Tax=Dimargaris verticillata TaxID=2761393 RepID=A0A9W8BBA0_9FUNG|nr:hypothetical protein H4R34_001166 [Dimargaris verticillata]
MNGAWRTNLQDEIVRRKALLAKAKAAPLANSTDSQAADPAATSSPSTSSTASSTTPRPKYLKKSELERLEREEYLKSQARREQERQAKRQGTATLGKRPEPDNSTGCDGQGSGAVADTQTPSRSLGLADAASLGPAQALARQAELDAADSQDTFSIAADEVIRRLRAKGQPIRLFGETDRQRSIRLRALELMEERSEGQRNDFMKNLEEMESGLALEALQKQAEGDSTESAAVQAKRRKKEQFMKDYDTTRISLKLLQTDIDLVYTLIYVYLKRLMYEWEEELNNRPDRVKTSAHGKLAAATQKQCVDYLRPLFKQLKRKQVEPDVLARLVEITENMQAREYVQANSAYLQLSIGNAPWPIGVTMVGIHARSAREKINASHVAHALNDETQRKWIQSVKRLMTFAQNKYPPADGAKAIG